MRYPHLQKETSETIAYRNRILGNAVVLGDVTIDWNLLKERANPKETPEKTLARLIRFGDTNRHRVSVLEDKNPSANGWIEIAKSRRGTNGDIVSGALISIDGSLSSVLPRTLEEDRVLVSLVAPVSHGWENNKVVPETLVRTCRYAFDGLGFLDIKKVERDIAPIVEQDALEGKTLLISLDNISQYQEIADVSTPLEAIAHIINNSRNGVVAAPSIDGDTLILMQSKVGDNMFSKVTTALALSPKLYLPYLTIGRNNDTLSITPHQMKNGIMQQVTSVLKETMGATLFAAPVARPRQETPSPGWTA